MQVMTAGQNAIALILCGPSKAVAVPLLHYLAQHNGFPTEQEIVAAAHSHLPTADWSRFWLYTESVCPYSALHADYVPIGKNSCADMPSASSSALSLY